MSNASTVCQYTKEVEKLHNQEDIQKQNRRRDSAFKFNSVLGTKPIICVVFQEKELHTIFKDQNIK